MQTKAGETVRVMMARQPIFDRRNRITAYELLYRSDEPHLSILDDATSIKSLLVAIAELGLQRLVGPHPACFNVSQGLLHHPGLRLLPSHRVVLEILENIEPDIKTLEAIQRLRDEGYVIALDDFIFLPHQMKFLGHVDIIKVDVLGLKWRDLVAGMPRLKATGARLLAEKVESKDMFERCKRLGFHMFQGYYFERPETLEERSLPPNRAALMRVLSEVHRPDARAEDIERAVAADPGLAVRLLKFVNSASMALPRRVDSIRTAVSMLGARRIQALAVLLAAQSRAEATPALAGIALVRARVCEELARRYSTTDPSIHFTIGLLSVMDAMLDLPMEMVVANIPLNPAVAEALVNPFGDSPEGRMLRLALWQERADWDHIESAGMDPSLLTRLYAEFSGGYTLDYAA